MLRGRSGSRQRALWRSGGQRHEMGAVQGCVEVSKAGGDSRCVSLPREPGVYVLLLCVPAVLALPVGSLGLLRLAPGYYAYVGSAMGGIRRRCRRYSSPPGRMRWHIDFLSSRAHICEVHRLLTRCRLKCKVAGYLSQLLEPVAVGFGTSDCRCPTHLFCGGVLDSVRSTVVAALHAAARSTPGPARNSAAGQGRGEAKS